MLDDELEPLKVSCTTTDCEQDLHCFRQKKKRGMGRVVPNEPGTAEGSSWLPYGPCRDCGVSLVDWEDVHRQDASSIADKLKIMHQEWIRHHFWHTDFSQEEINYALRKGRVEMAAHARKRLRDSVGKAINFREGQQTPYHGKVVYHAQHATATCCRACIEYWHAIPPGRELSESELDYLTELVMFYICERVPTLQEQGIKVPPIRRN